VAAGVYWQQSLRQAACHRPFADSNAAGADRPLVHGMTVVTRNVADFKPTGVTIINPWEAQQ